MSTILTEQQILDFKTQLFAGTPQFTTGDTVDVSITKQLTYFWKAIEPQSKRYWWDAMPHDESKWAELFSMVKGNVKTVNGFVALRTDMNSAWRGNLVRTNMTYKYDILIFRGFWSDSREANSDVLFRCSLDQFWYLLKHQPKLGMDCEVEQHNLPQFTNITSIGEGNEIMHFAPGTIEVELCQK